MKTEAINILNLSCGGCVNTITKKLREIKGVENVDVNLDTQLVTVACLESIDRTELTEMLKSIGYPESTDNNNIVTQLKSVKSCLIGKLS
ncbi:MAG: heavy metal-associated domain-containing protein [Bacteroidota bacterium]|nr:heavy metal-associated domain-containing protein [Bacteroidota bacterium]